MDLDKEEDAEGMDVDAEGVDMEPGVVDKRDEIAMLQHNHYHS